MKAIVLPIYYTKEYKRGKTMKRKNKEGKVITKVVYEHTFLVGMNWYRNVDPYTNNEVKTWYDEEITKQLGVNPDLTKPFQYTLNLKLYYSNPSCDGSNIFSLMEKYTLDSLQKLGWVKQDNVKFHTGTTTEVVGKDSDNPRVVAEIIRKEDA